MSITVDWLIGAIVVPAGGWAYTINGTGYTVAAGTYYLDDPTGSLSLCTQVVTDMTTEGLTNPAMHLTQAGYIQITSDDNFAIVFSNTDLRDAIGFAGNIGSTMSATATLYAPAFWSPGYRGTPRMSPGGVVGTKVYDTMHTVSPSGQTGQATTHHTRVEQHWSWSGVYIDRVWTTDENGLGGEFRKFYDDVLRKGYRFKLYPGITEDRSSSTEVTLTTPLGPYKIHQNFDGWYSRMIPHADLRTPIDIKVYQTAEVS